MNFILISVVSQVAVLVGFVILWIFHVPPGLFVKNIQPKYANLKYQSMFASLLIIFGVLVQILVLIWSWGGGGKSSLGEKSIVTSLNPIDQSKSIHPACVGSYEREKCEALYMRLSQESVDDAARRRHSLEEERRKNMDMADSYNDATGSVYSKNESSVLQEGGLIFPKGVKTTWTYKPFFIASTVNKLRMQDVQIAAEFMCKPAASTLQSTMDLFKNYDLIDTSKTDGTLTITSFRGFQEDKRVVISLAVDEQSIDRIVRYVLVDGQPALVCE
jgi:hypothetical protein